MAIENKRDHQIKMSCMSDKGGKVTLNDDHGVWAAYAVATAGDLPPPELFHAEVILQDGNLVRFFCNRESGLITAAIVSEDGEDRNELLRTIASEVRNS